jgi:hypothetical protein
MYMGYYSSVKNEILLVLNNPSLSIFFKNRKYIYLQLRLISDLYKYMLYLVPPSRPATQLNSSYKMLLSANNVCAVG